MAWQSCYREDSAQRHETHCSSFPFLLTTRSHTGSAFKVDAWAWGEGTPPQESPVVLLGPQGQFCDLCVCTSPGCTGGQIELEEFYGSGKSIMKVGTTHS